jgi:peptidoglycan/LPS O-acetylase OafA/YrhL
MVRRDVVAALTGRSQLKPLTSLRFFAALGVVLFHFGGPLLGHAPRALSNIIGAGYVGVSFFFVLSGFVLAYAYTALDARDVTAVRSFFSARLARIYPAYLLSFVLCAPFVARAIGSSGNPGDAPARVVGSGFAALVLLQGWFPDTVGLWNFPAWSLSVELFLYFVFPYAIGRARTANPRRALAVTFPFVLVASLVQSAALEPAGAGGHVTAAHWLAAHCPLPVLHVPQFLFGVILGSAFSRGEARRPAGSAAAWLSGASALAIPLVLTISPHIPRAFLEDGLLAPLFGALIYGLACGGGPLAAVLSRSWLVKLGDASYAVYILQVPVHDWTMRLASFDPNKSLHVMAYLVALVGVSLAAHQLVERPGRQLILELASGLFAPSRVRPLFARRRSIAAQPSTPGPVPVLGSVNPGEAPDRPGAAAR